MRTSYLKRLRQIPLFAQLGPEDLAAVAKLLKREYCRAGEVIAQQGQPGRNAYFVESGELQAWHIDAEGTVQKGETFPSGAFFGQTSLILGEPHDVTIGAVHDTTILYLNKDAFDRLLAERPSLLKSLQLRPDVERKLGARRFRWQEPDEVVSLSLHKHGAVLIRILLLPSFVLLVAVVAALYPRFLPSPLRIAAAVLALIPLGAIGYLIVDHFNDNYVVTNKRVLHEERVFVIREYRTEAPLHMIQDIHQTQAGLLAHFFKFGDLIIETAGESGHVVFRQVPNPDETRDAIFGAIERVRSVARVEERAAIRSALHRQFGSQASEDQDAAPGPSPAEQLAPGRSAQWAAALRRATAFVLPPLRYEEGDTITWRKHWAGLLRPISVPTAGIALVTLLALFLLYQRSFDWPLVLLGYGVGLVALFPWWLWIFSDWQNDMYQITATRIIDVERRPFYLSEQRREASLSRVQNISLTIPGVLGRMLNYGSITIETAGQGAFTFEYVKDPRDVQAEIFRRIEAFQQHQRQQDADTRRVELMDWFAVYDQIRDSPRKGTGSRPPQRKRS